MRDSVYMKIISLVIAVCMLPGCATAPHRISASYVSPLGYEIIPAIDAEEALVFLQNNSCDLILLDLLLPKMQGDELCKKLKADDKYKNIPVILFTASAIRTNLPEKIKEMGADDCVIKPFKPEELLEKVKRFIGLPS